MQKLKDTAILGKNMRRLRKAKKLTQDQLVAQLNLADIDISRGCYARYETGELNVPVPTLIALHHIYGCSYDEFFQNKDVLS